MHTTRPQRDAGHTIGTAAAAAPRRWLRWGHDGGVTQVWQGRREVAAQGVGVGG
jgi:hypothetical protein